MISRWPFAVGLRFCAQYAGSAKPASFLQKSYSSQKLLGANNPRAGGEPFRPSLRHPTDQMVCGRTKWLNSGADFDVECTAP
mgnify:CR=1 FL=1